MIKKNSKKPRYWLNAVKHLQSNDPVLSKLINKHRSKTYLISENSTFIIMEGLDEAAKLRKAIGK